MSKGVRSDQLFLNRPPLVLISLLKYSVDNPILNSTDLYYLVEKDLTEFFPNIKSCDKIMKIQVLEHIVKNNFGDDLMIKVTNHFHTIAQSKAYFRVFPVAVLKIYRLFSKYRRSTMVLEEIMNNIRRDLHIKEIYLTNILKYQDSNTLDEIICPYEYYDSIHVEKIFKRVNELGFSGCTDLMYKKKRSLLESKTYKRQSSFCCKDKQAVSLPLVQEVHKKCKYINDIGEEVKDLTADNLNNFVQMNSRFIEDPLLIVKTQNK